MRQFFRKNKTFVTLLVAIVIGVIMACGQMRQRDKVDADALMQGDVLTIPEVSFK